MADEEIEVVLTVGGLDATVVALREFLHRANAVQVQAVVDRGEDAPAIVSCGRLEPIEVTYPGPPERVVHLPHATPLEPAPPEDLPSVPPLPPFEVDAGAGTVTGPLGGIEAAARAVEALAGHLGGRSVALAFYPTTTPDVPLGIAARPGEPTLLTLGDEQFTMP